MLLARPKISLFPNTKMTLYRANWAAQSAQSDAGLAIRQKLSAFGLNLAPPR
jgi:hypothetical protein